MNSLLIEAVPALALGISAEAFAESGAFIIEGDYDTDLQGVYPDLDKTQKVIVVQRFTDIMDLQRASNSNTRFSAGPILPESRVALASMNAVNASRSSLADGLDMFAAAD